MHFPTDRCEAFLPFIVVVILQTNIVEQNIVLKAVNVKANTNIGDGSSSSKVGVKLNLFLLCFPGRIHDFWKRGIICIMGGGSLC